MSRSDKALKSSDGNLDPIGDRIVAAAARAFTRHGYAGASTAAIAQEAKTSKREIYDRFPSKDALFENVMQYLCALGSAASGSAQEGASKLTDELRSAAKAVLARFSLPETRGVLTAAIGASAQFPGVLDIFWQQGPGQAVDHIASILQKRFAKGEIRQAPFEEVAATFVYQSCGPIVLRQIFDPDFRPDTIQIDRAIDDAIANAEARLSK